MVKEQSKDYQKNKKQTNKKGSRNSGKKVSGRPKRSSQERNHEQHYLSVKGIIEPIAFLTEQFQKQKQMIECSKELNDQFSALFDKDFDSYILNEKDRKIYVNKNTLHFWLHYLSKDNKTQWQIEEILNLILFWFLNQNILPKCIYQNFRDQSFLKQFKYELFRDQDIQSSDYQNLLIILIIELASFENLDFIQSINSDPVLEQEKFFNKANIEYISTLIQNREMEMI